MTKQELIQSMGKFLNERPWHIFGTFTTSYFLSDKQARRLAERVYSDMSNKAPESVTMFWVAETFRGNSDYHLHTLLYVKGTDSDYTLEQVKESWNKVSRSDGEKAQNIIHLDKYDVLRGASYYISKHITSPKIDYDYMIPEIKI